MALPRNLVVTTENLTEVVTELVRIVAGEVEFGHPQDPSDANSLVLADGASHNGTSSNIAGSIVELDIEATDTRVDFPHNLSQPVTVDTAVNQPNVRWWVIGIRHDGQGVAATSPPIGLVYETGDAGSITEDSFPLRLYGSETLGRVIDADHPVRVTVFFTRAVR